MTDPAPDTIGPSLPSTLWWTPEFPPNLGGIATFVGHIAPELARRGHEVTVLVVRGSDEPREAAHGMMVLHEPLREALEAGDPATTVRLQLRVKAIKRDVRPDVYHLHLCEPTPFLHLVTIDAAPAPTVLTLHNEHLDGFDPDNPDTLIGRLFRASQVITCVSAATTRVFASTAPLFSHRLVTIPNAAPEPEPPAPYPDDLRIVAIGRLAHQKGFDRLLRAMPGVLARAPEVHLDILGEGPDRADLEAIIGELGLDGAVTLHGKVDRSDVAAFIGRSRVVVAPSRFEGLAYAALEAAGNGRAIIGTRVAGTEDVVDPGVTGILIDNEAVDDDPGLLSAALVELLEDPIRAEAMGAAGRERTLRVFPLDRCVDAYAHVYRAVRAPQHDVAVVIPVHDGERHIGATLNSVLADVVATAGISVQVLVIDDGSTDGTADIVAGYAGQGVDLFTQPPLGAGLARNAGIALTRSTWIATFDADDLWPAGRLRTLLDAAAPTDEAVFGRAVEFADHDAPPTAAVDRAPRAVRMPTTGLVRRSTFDRIGGFGALSHNDQIEWTSRALTSGLRYRTIDAVVLERRIHASNMSHRWPFLTDPSRLAVVRAHLQRRRDPLPHRSNPY